MITHWNKKVFYQFCLWCWIILRFLQYQQDFSSDTINNFAFASFLVVVGQINTSKTSYNCEHNLLKTIDDLSFCHKVILGWKKWINFCLVRTWVVLWHWEGWYLTVEESDFFSKGRTEGITSWRLVSMSRRIDTDN